MSANVWREGGLVYVRASAFGGCLRGLAATLAGFSPRPFDDRSELRMNEGNLHEPDILRRLGEEHGWHALDVERAAYVLSNEHGVKGVLVDTDEDGKAQIRVEHDLLPGLVHIRGHVDGIVRGSGTIRPRELRVAEAKAVGRDVYKRWLDDGWDYFGNYAVQLSLYMLALDLPAVFAVKNRDSGELDVTTWNEPPVEVVKLRAKAMQLYAGGSTTSLPNCDREPQWNCAFRFLHVRSEEDAAREVELSAEQVAELNALGATWRQLRAWEDESTKRRKEIAKQVRSIVGDKATARTNEFTVSTFEKTHTSFDMDELRKAAEAVGLDIDDYKIETRSKQTQFRARSKKAKGEKDAVDAAARA